MGLNRTPNIMYNASGYYDKTARDAICKADRDMLKHRRLQLLNKLRSIAKENGFRICGEIYLAEIDKEDDEA